MRNFSLADNLIFAVDQMVRSLSPSARAPNRAYPAENTEEPTLTQQERTHAAGLMRVNHAGEVCAQALYHGQGIVSRDQAVQEKMQEAAIEEGDHLAWCEKRLVELGSHTSYLNPLWYAGSFAIGMAAGTVGDAWSLGFVAETERQVIKHLESHVALLPKQDEKSYRILEQMRVDEAKHRDEAIAAGARELPKMVKWVMGLTSKVMVKTAYWV